MSQTIDDRNVTTAPPTSEEVIGKVNESISALQAAQQTVVEGARLLGDHVNDPKAHGAGVQASIEAAMPQPVWDGTSLKFQKPDGTMVAEAVDLKGEPGQIGPRPEHRWDETGLKIQNADGSWPETGVNLKGDKGEPGELASLSDAVDSDSSATAASSKAVKTAYDKASGAEATATAAQSAADAAQAAAQTADVKAGAALTSAGEAKSTAQTALTRAEQALAGGGGSGGGGVIMAAPSVSGNELVAIGHDNPFSARAVPGLLNTRIAKFVITANGGTPFEAAAVDNACDFTVSVPEGTEAGIVWPVSVQAVDTMGNRSAVTTLSPVTSPSRVMRPKILSPELRRGDNRAGCARGICLRRHAGYAGRRAVSGSRRGIVDHLRLRRTDGRGLFRIPHQQCAGRGRHQRHMQPARAPEGGNARLVGMVRSRAGEHHARLCRAG